MTCQDPRTQPADPGTFRCSQVIILPHLLIPPMEETWMPVTSVHDLAKLAGKVSTQ